MNLVVWAERIGVAWVSGYRWFGAGLLPVAARRVWRLILVDDPVVEESRRGRDLVGDVSEILTSMGARLYGERAAQSRARRAVAAAAEDAEAP